mmetsp:Transcript_16646/g.31566  ORF Transcript_16646/g.31566 Transcript_16646/m.31566 type:complete len:367 (-) Transcript_16646:144-1244(-)
MPGGLLLAPWALFLILEVAGHDNGGPPSIIVDTDMSIDCDDVAALCVAHSLMDEGKANLLAVVHNTGLPEGIGAVSVINHYYGRDDVELGAFKGSFGESISGPYVQDLVSSYASPVKNSSQVPDAVATYRSVLSRQANRSVTIVSIGFATNLAALLQSLPDQHSSLNGRQLVEAKVARVAWMGGRYPSSYSSSQPEWNFGGGDPRPCAGSPKGYKCSSTAANYTLTHLPGSVDVVFSGFEVGAAVLSGAALTSCHDDTNPCRRACIDEDGPGVQHRGWDQSTMLVGIFGATQDLYLRRGLGGANLVDPRTGHNRWEDRSNSTHRQKARLPHASYADYSEQTYLSLKHDAATRLGKTIDELLCRSRT